MSYSRPDLILDAWQQEIIETPGDCGLLKGRRVGGTELFGIKAAERMVKGHEEIIVVSLTEDQAQLIIDVALNHLMRYHPQDIDLSAKHKPTLNTITTRKFKSTLEARPVGSAGLGIRGFNGTILGIDEAPHQPARMWRAARPVLTTTNGEIWMWGTPAGKEGYFWEQYKKSMIEKDEHARFKFWHKTTPEVLLSRPISLSWTVEQREGALRIIEEERKSMSEVEFSNEYLGMFMDEASQFYSDAWIDSVCKGTVDEGASGKIYLGIDCARFGKDESTWTPFIESRGEIRMLDAIVKTKLDIVQGVQMTEAIAEKWRPRKLCIDAGSGTIGVSWLDLLQRTKWQSKLVPLNNRKIIIDIDNEDTQTMLKADMYYNMLALGEKGKLILLDTPEVRASLRSIKQEVVIAGNGKTQVRIFGSKGSGGDHITEAAVRAVYIAHKEKALNLLAY